MKEKVKICFWDCDGVVSTEHSLYKELAMYFNCTVKEIEDGTPEIWCEKSGLPYPWVSMHHWPFDQEVIYRAYKLHAITKCKFVMCSSWRTGMTVEEINDEQATKGFRIKFIDKTGHGGKRGEEIQKWLDDNKDKYDVETYVIIDDDSSYDIREFHPNNCVEPKFKTGFTDELLEEAINILNK